MTKLERLRRRKLLQGRFAQSKVLAK